MLVDPANARKLANIAAEVGAVVIDSPLSYLPQTGNHEIGGVVY